MKQKQQDFWFKQGWKDEKTGTSSIVPKNMEKWYQRGVDDYLQYKLEL